MTQSSAQDGTWENVSVDGGTTMRVYVARPSGAAAQRRLPGVMVLQEAFGVNHHIRDVAHRVAQLGFVAAAPELFHRTAPPGFETGYENVWPTVAPHFQAVTDAGLTADLQATLAWLTADAQCNGSVGTVGFCMGGRAAFLANAVLPLGCAVSFYGGRIATQLLQHAPQMNGPILLFWGGLDTGIGRVQQRATADALAAAGKPFVDVEFSNAEHGFHCNERKSFHGPSARQAWALTTAFLAEHLGG